MDFEKFSKNDLIDIICCYKYTESELLDYKKNIYENFEFPTYIFENKWFSGDYYINVINTQAIIYFYSNDLFVLYEGKFKRLKGDFWEIYSEIINFLTENNILFFNLNLYEMGNYLFNLYIKKTDLLSVIVVPGEFIKKYNERYFIVKGVFKSNNIFLPKVKSNEILYSKYINYPNKAVYKKNLNKIRRYIVNGYTYQINYTERIFINKYIHPYDIFEKVRNNQNSYSAYFTISKNRIVISDSPERLFIINNDKIKAEPIKGTISTKIPDYCKKLMNSNKDLRELSMITDLLRNDISSLIQKNTLNVKYPVLMKLREVAHLYSEVSGKLNEDILFSDIIKNLFPGGSITGVPKKMTMKIISHIEKGKRKIYTGSLGIVNSNNNIDYNILIRSFYLEKNKYVYGTGGGITISSDIEEEWKELINKSEKIQNL
ncbi:MAG: chorismate-binding protein [Candidatus Muirbacterium halophilum]|nr:chorismate-binding protein [Candidatus Muirbacterium halophilum]